MKTTKRTICIKSETSFILNYSIYPQDKCKAIQQRDEQRLRERLLRRQMTK